MHRSQSRERLRGACDPFIAVEPLSYEPKESVGCVQPKNYIKPSRMELGSKTLCSAPSGSNYVPFDFKSSSKKETRPIRATLAEEMSTERQMKRSPPSVIARLMGLDALPSPGFHKPLKETSSLSGKFSSKELQKPTRHEDCLLKKRSGEHQECKDVFEVREGQQVGNHKQGIRKQMPNIKHSEMDMAFIRQSFINAKRLSTDEKLQRSKEFDDALEVLESNKDLFLKLLQEPHSLFSEHLDDRSQSPLFQSASHPSVRKSSRGSLTVKHESPPLSEIRVGRYTSPQLSDSESLRQHAVKSNGHSFKEHIFSFPEKYSDSIYGGKIEDIAPHKQIVILKPSLNKAQRVERTGQSVISLEKNKHGVTNHRELSEEEIIDLFQKERDRQNLHTLGNMRHRTKHTVELAKNVTQQIRSSSVTGRKACAPKYSNYVQDNDLSHITRIAGVKNSPTSYRNCDNINGYYKSSCPSPSCTIESSVDMETRKNLSEQRRLTRRLQEIDLSMRESNTLSEMLALSDKGISKSARYTSGVKKACPSSISSNDSWKNGSSRNLSRSKSLPVSSLVYGNPQHNSRNGVVGSRNRVMPKNVCNMNNEAFVDRQNKSKFHSVGEENRLPVLGMHVMSEESKNKSNPEILTEEEHCNFSHILSPYVVDILSVPSSNIMEPSFSMKYKGLEELQKVIRSGINGEHIEGSHSKLLLKLESSSNQDGDVLPPPNCSKSSAPLIFSKEADQPSPVSVLDLSSKGEISTPGCFKKINSDLQELRRQLHILKFDSDHSFVKEIEAFIPSDEDAVEPFSQLDDIHQSFRDEEDRDYSYLLDMLINSEILKLDKSGLIGICHSTELPVGTDVFDKLEKKYKSFELWSRSGRKLLFDLVNSTIADVAAVPWLMRSRLSWQSKMAYEGLVEEIWQAVVKRRKEVRSYPEEDFIGLEWFGFGHIVSEVVGRELENMLLEHIMDELVEELMYMKTSLMK